MLLVGVGQDQRGRDGFERPRNHHPRFAVFLVELELDRHELRFVEVADSRSQEFKPCITRLSAEDREQSVALLLGRSMVDEGLQGAVALVKRPRPFVGGDPTQAVQADVSEVALLDEHSGHALASLVWIWDADCIARTTRDAVAVFKIMALHQPVDLCHEFPLAGCRVRFFADTEFSPNAGLLQEAQAAVVDLRGSEGLSCAWPAPAN